MLGDGALTFREFAMREPLPLATIHDAVLEFLRGRDDAVLFGAQAVNAYVDEPRMTQDVDILSPRAQELAEEIRIFLNEKFRIAVRVRQVREGLGYRIYQVQKLKNRHLVDVRLVQQLPPTQRVTDVLVVTPSELIANKVIALERRRGKPKSGTDWRDRLKTCPDEEGIVGRRRVEGGGLRARSGGPEKMSGSGLSALDHSCPDDAGDSSQRVVLSTGNSVVSRRFAAKKRGLDECGGTRDASRGPERSMIATHRRS